MIKGENCSEKVVVFAIEEKFETIYEKLFVNEQINDLIKCISETIFACLCLKPVERELFDFISKESTSLIVSLKDKTKCKSILDKFKKTTIKEKCFKITSVCEPNLIELIIYYNELLLIVQKLKSMYKEDFETEELRITTLLEL